jgi:hypothetical protein
MPATRRPRRLLDVVGFIMTTGVALVVPQGTNGRRVLDFAYREARSRSAYARTRRGAVVPQSMSDVRRPCAHHGA